MRKAICSGIHDNTCPRAIGGFWSFLLVFFDKTQSIRHSKIGSSRFCKLATCPDQPWALDMNQCIVQRVQSEQTWSSLSGVIGTLACNGQPSVGPKKKSTKGASLGMWRFPLICIGTNTNGRKTADRTSSSKPRPISCLRIRARNFYNTINVRFRAHLVPSWSAGIFGCVSGCWTIVEVGKKRAARSNLISQVVYLRDAGLRVDLG